MGIIKLFKVKKTRWILTAAAAAVIAVAVAVPLMNDTAAAAAPSAAQVVTKDVQVEKGNITVGVTETGTASINTQDVTCGLTGAVVDQVLVKAGQSVKTGDPIATLTADSVNTAVQTAQVAYDQAENKLKQAQAALTNGQVNAKTTYNTSVAKSKNAQTTYNDTVAQLNDAVTSATNAYNSCVGTINYYNTNMASLKSAADAADQKVADDKTAGIDVSDPAQYQDDVAAQTAADKAYTDAQNDLASQQQQEQGLKDKLTAAQHALSSGTVDAQSQMQNDQSTGGSASTTYNNTVAALQSSVDSANLDVTTAKAALDKLTPYQKDPTVYSTASGLVDSVSYSAGATVTDQSNVIATIADNTTAYLLVSVTQDDIASLSVGQEATATLSAVQDQQFTGKIDSITITPARSASSTVSYSVTVKLDGDVSKIYDGMTGDVTFVTKQVKDVLYVSNKAVTTENGKQYVNVKNADGTTAKTQVTTGFSDGTNVEIQSGLTEGQTVVITTTQAGQTMSQNQTQSLGQTQSQGNTQSGAVASK